MPDHPLIIRQATREDLPAIVHLIADDPLGQQRELDQVPLPASYLAAFEQIDSDPNCELLVAELAGQVVGTMQINYLWHISYQGGKRAQLESVHVGQAWRSQGIGGQMLHWAIARARQEGCCLVQLTSHTSRQDAQRFYRRLGFVSSHVGMKLALTPARP